MKFTDEIIRSTPSKELRKKIDQIPDKIKTNDQLFVKLYCLISDHEDCKGIADNIVKVPANLPETAFYVLSRVNHQQGFHEYLKLVRKCPDELFYTISHSALFCSSLDLIDIEESDIHYIESVLHRILIEQRDNHKLATQAAGKIIDFKSRTAQLDFKNPLLIECMKREFIPYAEFEKRYNIARKKLFKKAVEQREVSAKDLETIFCFAIQQHHKDHCSYIDSQEQETLINIKKLAEEKIKQSESIAPISLYLLLYSMYEPLSLIKGLTKQADDSLPETLLTLIFLGTENRKQLDLIQEKITSLTTIEDHASKVVRSQYEENPYPKWHRIALPRTANLQAYLNLEQLPDADRIASRMPSKPEILVAGCGTGQQPISIALLMPYANITAIDLSRRSIAYAIQKSAEHHVKNIEYYHADILKLPETEKRFDIIHCGGVLHHMGSPETGLKALVNVLKPGGILRIAVYSTIARRSIKKHRDSITHQEIKPSTSNIRNYRARIISSNFEEGSPTGFRDFYNLNECRDLLFHTHEKTYTWPDIAELLDIAELELIRIALPEFASNKYMDMYPDDKAFIDIQAMHSFEEKHPDTWQSMMTFWCKKPEAH